jgi:hypothetical protein
MFRYCMLGAILIAASLPSHAQEPPKKDGKTAQHWAKDLLSDDPKKQLAAAEALAAMGKSAKPALPSLLKAIPICNDEQINALIQQSLEKIGKDAVPSLIHALKNKDENVRIVAARSLCTIGTDARPALAALTGALADSQSAVAEAAAKALANFGPEAKSAVPALLSASRRSVAAAEDTLLKLGKDAVPGLIEALGHRDADERDAAADLLGRIGPSAKAAIPTLTTAVHDSSRQVRESAAIALEKIKGADSKAPREIGFRDFSGVWSGPMEKDAAASDKKCMMFLNLDTRGEGTVSITGSGDSSIDGRFSVQIREVKNGKAAFKENKGHLRAPKDGKITAIWKPTPKTELHFELSRQN